MWTLQDPAKSKAGPESSVSEAAEQQPHDDESWTVEQDAWLQVAHTAFPFMRVRCYLLAAYLHTVLRGCVLSLGTTALLRLDPECLGQQLLQVVISSGSMIMHMFC